MTIIEFMWHIAKYSVFGVKVLIDPYPEPLEITGVNVRDLEFETAFGTRVIPKEFTKIQLYLYPLSHLDGDDLFRYQAWSRPPVDPEPQEKFLERMNNLEKLLFKTYRLSRSYLEGTSNRCNRKRYIWEYGIIS